MSDDDKSKEQTQGLRDALGNLNRNSELIEANQAQAARLLFQRYQALNAAGFTKEQSFQIVLQRGFT